ncbi:MAG: hypothetical protein AB7W47_14950 [Calditrichaceae bacterium]
MNGRKKKDTLMKDQSVMSRLEAQKIELIKLRIKNKYYDKDSVLDKVISEIVKTDINENSR